VRLRNCAPNVADSVYFADLTSLAEMKCVAAQIADQEHRTDVLINNAGALFARRRLTQDGLECSPIRLPPRIRTPPWIFDDLQSAKNHRALKAYSRSKLCNILLTRELPRRLHGTVSLRRLGLLTSRHQRSYVSMHEDHPDA
jgi:NAD(P)-dependent dehydrogenase (short-subunit alcohol dehydrogenase family)